MLACIKDCLVAVLGVTPSIALAVFGVHLKGLNCAMKTTVLLLCLVAVTYGQQRPPDGTRPPPTGTRPLPDGTRPLPTGEIFTRPPFTRPPRTDGTRPTPDSNIFDPRLNPESMCGFSDRMCEEGVRCIQDTRADSVINICSPLVNEGGPCMRAPVLDRDNRDDRDREDKVRDDTRITPERESRERGSGARDRDTARTINGVENRPECQRELRCMEDVCRRPDMTRPCFMRAMTGDQVQCRDDGMFEPRQCRINPQRGDGSSQEEITATCSCVRPLDGEIIRNTTRRVTRKDQAPDCESRSFRSCNVMRQGRMVSVRHGESVPMRQGQTNRCQRCECEDGSLQCSNLDEDSRCPRSDPNQRPANCMTRDGEEVQHGEMRQDGSCNMCRCVDGQLRCTRAMECRGENDGGRDSDRVEEERRCEECMDMPNDQPVCAVRDGRTFPTRCHAMRCQGFERDDLTEGPCSQRNPCQEEMCEDGFSCMPRGGQTRMSREASRPDDTRVCVNRMELHCSPTIIEEDGSRRLKDDDSDVLEVLEFDGRNDRDDDNRTVCASDGRSYPSTCHLIAESRQMMVPRVMHTGRCRQMNGMGAMVCATDGVTYPDEATMRTVGGNVRMDYMGRCDDPDSDEDATPRQRCMRVKESGRCPNLGNCTRRPMTQDGCCPVCGGVVNLAMDQDAIDENVVNANKFTGVDDVMGQMFRRDGDREPVVDRMAPMRCDISMVAPTKSPRNTTEVLFRARNATRDDEYCHQQAMRMMTMLNQPQTITVTTEQDIVAAAVVAPDSEVELPGGGAPAFAASCLMLLGSALAALFL